MRDFFSMDGAFNKYGGFVADTVILGLLWIFFSLPIVTIGASTTALFYVSTRRIANRERYITSDFWQSFKANFLRATTFWIALIAIVMMIAYNMWLALQNPEMMGPLSILVLPAQIIILLEIMLIAIYIFPVTARFDMGIRQTLKTCFFMANRHLLTSITCMLILAALLVAIPFFPPIAFVAPGIYAMLSSYMLMRIFKRYRPEMDKDPVLELQELEKKRAEEKRRAELGLPFTPQENPLIIGKNSEEETNMGLSVYTLANKNGMEMTVTNLGCAIITLTVPTKDGNKKDVVLGLDKPEDYNKPHPFFGVAVGRFANRIGGGKFSLGGKEYQLEKNDGGTHHLHGGSDGFDKKVWDVESSSNEKIVFTLNSPDGDSGYTGDLTARITYTLTDANVLRMDYEATTETETICNLTNHSYFNLCGHDAKDIFGHEMQIFSDKITEVDTGLIPTGGFVDIAGTPFDFRTPKTIGQDLQAAGDVNKTGGYDHNYVLRGEGKAATVYSPSTGIRMTVSTNSPGMQFYSANFVDGTVTGKGVTYQRYSGFCLETQLFPDSINKPDFPSCVVKKGTPQKFYTEFAFEW
ncbi:MAG: galactose-1-epimerase [Defluviitaleaceae bacterium]|nr:galactose-1-epimerase [Defluviitaleaceae bacterium]